MPTTTDPAQKMETLIAELQDKREALLSTGKLEGAAKKEAKNLKKAIKKLKKALKKLIKGNRRLKSGSKSEDVDIVKAAEDLLEAYEALECDVALKDNQNQNPDEFCRQIVSILGLLLKNPPI